LTKAQSQHNSQFRDLITLITTVVFRELEENDLKIERLNE